MNREQLINYLQKKPKAESSFPFGDEIEVFKVYDKSFAFIGTREGHDSVNLKCDPHEAVQLRDVFSAVIPGYHMNKKHWNTVILDGSIPTGEIQRMIDNSYLLVAKGLKKAQRTALEVHTGPL